MSTESKMIDSLEFIDACMFSGDTFQDMGALAMLLEYLGRWRREALRIAAEEFDEQPEEAAFEEGHPVLNLANQNDELRRLVGVFYAIMDEDVMPQVGKLVFQDYARLNEALIAAGKVKL